MTAEPGSRLVKVAEEILTSEQTYVYSLEVLNHVFITALKPHKLLLSEAIVQSFFANIEQVFILNLRFRDDLIAMLDSRKLAVGTLFLKYAPLLKLYGQYASNHDHAMAFLTGLRQSNPAFDATVVGLETSPSSSGQSLASLLIMPVQRVPRYVLLLKELKRNMPEDHPDLENLNAAITKVSEAADHINEAIRKRENREKIQGIEKLFGGSLELWEPGRTFVKEGPIQKMNHKGVFHEYFFILFSDLLILSKRTALGGYSLTKKIPLLSLNLHPKVARFASTPDGNLVFQIESPAISFIAKAANDKDKEDWMAAIQKVLVTVKAAAATALSTPGRSTTAAPWTRLATLFSKPTEESKAAPVWEVDSLAGNCSLCDSEFTLFNRRHHCRRCGKVVCNSCSPWKKILENIDASTPVRICNTCNTELRDQYQRASKYQNVLRMKSPDLMSIGSPEPSEDGDTDKAPEEGVSGRPKEPSLTLSPSASRKKTEPEEEDADTEESKSDKKADGEVKEGFRTRRVKDIVGLKKKNLAVHTALTELQWKFGAQPAYTPKSRTPKSSIFAKPAFKEATRVGIDEDESQKRRHEMAIDLEKTESSYLDDLKTLDEVFIVSLRGKIDLTKAPPCVAICFNSVEQMVTLHTKLLDDLRERLVAWSAEQRLGDVFIGLAPLFKIYAEYATHYEDALIVLRSPVYLEIVRKVAKSPQCEGKKLEHFLDAPMHRVPQYASNLKNMLKFTPSSHPDHIHVKRAIDSLTDAAGHINEAIQTRENRLKIMEVEGMFLGKVELVEPGRKYLREGLMQMANKKGELRKRHVHLFSDILVCSEIAPTGLKMKVILELSKIVAVDKLENDPTFKDAIALRTKEISYILCARNPTLQEDWHEALKKAIEDCPKTLEQRRAEEERISVAPIWAPDAVSTACTLCANPFSIWNRKHHCRECGALVCAECSPHKKTIPRKDDKEPVRVCYKCFFAKKKAGDVSESRPTEIVEVKAPMEDDEPEEAPVDPEDGEAVEAWIAKNISRAKLNATLRQSLIQGDDLAPSEAFTMAAETGEVQKFITEDGEVYYYDKDKGTSRWALDPAAAEEELPDGRGSVIEHFSDDEEEEVVA